MARLHVVGLVRVGVIVMGLFLADAIVLAVLALTSQH